MSAMMRLSKPAAARFEKGRLSGSAQTRNGGAAITGRQTSIGNRSAANLGKRKHIKRSSWLCCVFEIVQRASPSIGCGVVTRIEIGGTDRPRPSAYAGEDRNVLLAVRAAIGDRLANDARACFELPKYLSVACVSGFEPAIERAIENEIACRRNGPAPRRILVWNRPNLLSAD